MKKRLAIFSQTQLESVTTILHEVIKENTHREGLKETPQRFLKAWQEMTEGYHQNPVDIFKTFTDGAHDYNTMVVEKDLPFYSNCEHHMLPFFGTVTVAYIPAGKIIGLSKIGRVVDIFAKRLQVQERLTTLIADCMQNNLNPKGVGVLIKARHMCMEARGYSKQGHITQTQALRGEFMTDAAVRAEFLALAR